MLEANCDLPEEKAVKKHFSAEELIDMRKQFSENAITIRKATEKLNLAKEAYKIETQESINGNTYLMANIRAGFVEVNQQVYSFVDQTAGMMKCYDNTGELIDSRRLTPEERQTRIR